jgi:hypothetical protein
MMMMMMLMIIIIIIIIIIGKKAPALSTPRLRSSTYVWNNHKQGTQHSQTPTLPANIYILLQEVNDNRLKLKSTQIKKKKRETHSVITKTLVFYAEPTEHI